jgi:hypothetical protein
VFVAAKTGLVAWVAAASRNFRTTNLGHLRGWLRRTPILGVALVAIVIATLGWPGSPVYEARASLIRLGLPSGFGFVGAAAMLLSIIYYGRLLFVGLMSPGHMVRAAHGELPRWTHSVRRATAETAAEPELHAEAVAELAVAELVDEPVATEAAPAKKRRRRAAAAEEPLPTIAAAVEAEAEVEVPTEVVQLELSTGPDVAATPAATPGEPAPPAATRSSFPRRVVVAWRLNRTLEVSLVVACGAALAVAVAFGGFGTRGAAQSGIPLDAAAHATPTPTPVPTPAPTPTPNGSAEASPSASDTTEPGASASPNGSGNPSALPEPTTVKTAAPLRTVGS